MKIKYCKCGCGTVVKNRFVLGHNSKLMSQETKDKMSKIRKGKKQSIESNKKRSKTLIGHSVSLATKLKISKNHKGKKCPWVSVQNKKRKGYRHSKKTKLKISLGNKGKKRTEEQNKIMSLKLKGMKRSKEVRKNIIKHLTGRPVSLKTREKISKSNKGKKVSEKSKRKMSKSKKELYKNNSKLKNQISNSVKKYLKNNPDATRKLIQSAGKLPNQCEIKLNKILQKHFPNEWKYVGNGIFFIDGKCPDFIHLKQKLIIEFFGEFYHKKADTSIRKRFFLKNGYKTLIIWGKELRRPDLICNKIRRFST